MSHHLTAVAIQLRVNSKLADILPPEMGRPPDLVIDDDDAEMLMEATNGDIDRAADIILGMMGEAWGQLMADLREQFGD